MKKIKKNKQRSGHLWGCKQLHAIALYFIDISTFCKCEQASSKHIQIKKVYGHSTSLSASSRRQASPSTDPVPGQEGAAPPRPASETWGRRGGQAGQTAHRTPNVGISCLPRGAREGCWGRTACPGQPQDGALQTPQSSRDKAPRLDPTRSHTCSVLSTVQHSRGYPQKHGIRVWLT